MRLAGRVAWSCVLALGALAGLLAIHRLPTARGLAIWVVIVTALVLILLIRQSREYGGPEPASGFEAALGARKPPETQPEELLRMDREIVLGSADADHAHRRLLPLLRATASARIAARHGFELERRPEEAHALLGDDVWDLLRPDPPAPEDRHAPGVPRARIEAVIARVESL